MVIIKQHKARAIKYSNVNQFFFNNLPSFTRYKDKDELDWVVNNHRLLSYELLEYSKIKKSSLATLKQNSTL